MMQRRLLLTQFFLKQGLWLWCLMPLSTRGSGHGYWIQIYVIKFVSDLGQIGGYLRLYRVHLTTSSV